MKEKELLLFILLKRSNSRLKIVQNRPNAKGIMDKDETENANRHSIKLQCHRRGSKDGDPK